MNSRPYKKFKRNKDMGINIEMELLNIYSFDC